MGLETPKEKSMLLCIPSEIRLMIYRHLFDDHGHSSFEIRSQSIEKYRGQEQYRRKSYRILGGGMVRQVLTTTYHLTTSVDLHTNILAANKRIHGEASPLLYGKHVFDFGKDIEAIVPFLSDLAPLTRRLVQKVSLTKQASIYCREFDRAEWSNACTFLAASMNIRKLVLRVMGSLPSGKRQTEGIDQFTVSDFRTLAVVGFEGLEWVRELRSIKTLDDLEIIPSLVHCGPGRTSNNTMAFDAAFSRSIDKGFEEYLRTEMLIQR